MSHKTQSGQAVMAALVVLLLIAIGVAVGLAWISRDRLGALMVPPAPTPTTMTEAASAPPPAPGVPAPSESRPSAESPPQAIPPTEAVRTRAAPPPPPTPSAVVPGNPVVARVGGRDIHRVEVLEFIEVLPPDVREGKSVLDLFPDALAEMVDGSVVDARVADSGVAQDPKVAERLEQAQARIARSVYLQQQVAARLTEDKLRAAYNAYAAQAPVVEEIRARHVLVPTLEEAQTIIQQLGAGRSFEALAIAHSVDPSGVRGGDLGYFAPEDVVPAFGQAARTLPVGAYTKEPVETQFGWHVIQVEDRRARAMPSFAALRPDIERALEREVLADLLKDWRAQADVRIYGINGPPPGEAMPGPASEPRPLAPVPLSGAADFLPYQQHGGGY
ncbi:MAG TPA: hypothetical protein DDX54_04780 [Rhodospirillaceae bacterium]|jgi:peptidyl-prolyl cis-trans isomerase C|nr:peptidylprolyl isomerase [Alphaproteobacteria bacterium]HBH26696.1 hypothetical protein [Rhodospirillaceae bacterium]